MNHIFIWYCAHKFCGAGVIPCSYISTFTKHSTTKKPWEEENADEAFPTTKGREMGSMQSRALS